MNKATCQISEYIPCTSTFLSEGYRKERYTFDSIDYHTDHIESIFSIEDFEMPADGLFHLAATSLFPPLLQTAIIYGCKDNKLTCKRGESYLLDINVNFHKAINHNERISISMTAPNKKIVKNGASVVYKDMGFSIDDGKFTGLLSLLLPVA